MTIPALLNLRSKQVGGGVARKEDVSPPPLGQRRLVVLVHGYATNDDSAGEDYRRFVQNVEQYRGLGRSIPGTDWLGVFWPGNDKSWLVNRISFASRVDAAESSGERLANVLTKGNHRELYLVGHSLGCRAVLESLVKLRTSRHIEHVTGALLMAAAVPEDHCAPDGLYSDTLTGPMQQVVLWSRRDLVLSTVFRAGMRLARENASAAVGRTGGPLERWHKTSQSVGLGHGAYWRSATSARALLKLMGIDGPRLPLTRTVDSIEPPARELLSRRPWSRH